MNILLFGWTFISSDDGYEICGEDKKLRFKTRNGESIISICPGRSLRFRTVETIGIQNFVTGIVVNVAGMAVKGLTVAPGKVDPGFNPSQLVLVVSNLSKRSIDLREGDKIAAIAFAQTGKCAPTKSRGWADRKIEGYSRSSWDRFKDRMQGIDIFDILKNLFVAALGAAIALLVQYLLRKAGFN
jgi:deoxycytidine triphosphate deaminase